jgi:Phasin protein
MAFADQNMAAALEFAEKLIHTKHPIEVVQLQQQYLVRQMQALPSQTLELSRVGQELWVRSASRFPFFRRKIKADHPTW